MCKALVRLNDWVHNIKYILNINHINCKYYENNTINCDF